MSITKATSLNIITTSYSSDEAWDGDVALGYVEFTREVLNKLLLLRDKLDGQEFKDFGICSVETGLLFASWFTRYPSELEDVFEELTDSEEDWLSISRTLSDLEGTEEARTEDESCWVQPWGVSFSCNLKSTSIKISTPSFTWEDIESLLTLCPKSIDFVKKISKEK